MEHRITNPCPVSIVILTFNEELNLPHALKSAKEWSDDIHVVDSGSSDRTLDIANDFNAIVHLHSWENWAKQRNWSLENCPLKYEWVLFLDADEQLTPQSKEEIRLKIQNANDQCNGFYLRFDYYFRDRLVRKAMCPHLRLIRKTNVSWQVRGAREICSAPSDSPVIKAKLIHYDHRGLQYWKKKQTQNAQLEAQLLFQLKEKLSPNDKHKSPNKIHAKFGDSSTESLRNFIDSRSPLCIRPALIFTCHLIAKTDIRNGLNGLIHAYYQGLWFPIMVNIKYAQLLKNKTMEKTLER